MNSKLLRCITYLSCTLCVIGLPVLLALGAAGLFGPIWGHIMAGRVFSGTENYDKELEKQKRGEELRMHEQMALVAGNGS